METFMLPYNLRMDSWWLSADLTPARSPNDDRSGGTPVTSLPKPSLLWIALIALCLVGLANLLIYGHRLGLGVVCTALVVGVVAITIRRNHGHQSKHEALAFVVMILGVLPMIEYVQALSVMFFVVGFLGFVVLLNGNPDHLMRDYWKACKFWRLRFVLDIPLLKAEVARTDLAGLDWKRIISGLVLPLITGLIFLFLFISANPVLEAISKGLKPQNLVPTFNSSRVLFWGICLVLIWPFLRHFNDNQNSDRAPRTSGLGVLSKFFTQSSVRATLILSNVLFLMQGTTDIGYLVAGAKLPTGTTYAEYTHRGAYPLLITALLSGVMTVLFSQLATKDKLIRILTIFWMAQTLALLGSCVFRLSLYVDAYGLTLLRMWAVLWMVLVLTGISLIIVQLLYIKPIAWLLKWNAILVIVTLYACCFFNFTHFAASYNFSHLDDNRATEYACKLNEHAALSYFQAHGFTKPNRCFRNSLSRLHKADWREWNFRDARILKQLILIMPIDNERLPEAGEWRYGDLEEY